ncbi:putative Methyltransferase domain-containing protein [Seiridium cardinale]|uniref:Methyltransferase domain-containing protein n=1 Tax=Seiridium cardinale TaxID=138064 RepID=A0ABR2X8W9_9PEZI
MSFKPKQISPIGPEEMAELHGKACEYRFKRGLPLMPPANGSDTVHFFNCENIDTCIVTDGFPDIYIEATFSRWDVAQQFTAIARTTGPRMKVRVITSRGLDSPDNLFTHTIFDFTTFPPHDQAFIASEIYRTLKPGGTAMSMFWAHQPQVEALKHAHFRTRGTDGPMVFISPLESITESKVREILLAAGFKPDEVKFVEKEVFVPVPDIKRYAQLAWSCRGQLAGGRWLPNDELRWDEAVDDIVEQLEGGNNMFKPPSGGKFIRSIACFALATKPTNL